MVVIDEHDVGKTREQVLMDLIYESTRRRIPLDRIQFGKPKELDARKDLPKDPNTFIPVWIDPLFDDRFSTPGCGIMYRRRNITHHCREYDFSGVTPTQLPVKISDLLDQINEVMPYPLVMDDLIDVEYTTVEQLEAGITLTAHPESLLWINKHTFVPNMEFFTGESMIEVTDLPGFNYYGQGETYPA